ncbi:Helix-turn-helix domain protein [compost metagenome]
MAIITEIEQFVIDKVREFRLERKIGQEKLSIDMGLAAKFVGNVESPKRPEKYNINHLNKIAEIFDCSIKDFFPDQYIPGELLKRIVKVKK